MIASVLKGIHPISTYQAYFDSKPPIIIEVDHKIRYLPTTSGQTYSPVLVNPSGKPQ